MSTKNIFLLVFIYSWIIPYAGNDMKNINHLNIGMTEKQTAYLLGSLFIKPNRDIHCYVQIKNRKTETAVLHFKSGNLIKIQRNVPIKPYFVNCLSA